MTKSRPRDRTVVGAESRHRAWPRPVTPSFSARAMYRLHRWLEPNRFYARVARRLESMPGMYRLFTKAEERIKAQGFGCRMCGQCALPATGYTCPMTCPKGLRNGPCGGVSPTGRCEVYPEVRCVWVVAFERAEEQGRADDLSLLQRPIDHRQWGSSSWVNYWQGRDEGLWTAVDDLGTPPPVRGVDAETAGR